MTKNIHLNEEGKMIVALDEAGNELTQEDVDAAEAAADLADNQD